MSSPAGDVILAHGPQSYAQQATGWALWWCDSDRWVSGVGEAITVGGHGDGAGSKLRQHAS